MEYGNETKTGGLFKVTGNRCVRERAQARERERESTGQSPLQLKCKERIMEVVVGRFKQLIGTLTDLVNPQPFFSCKVHYIIGFF